MKNSNKLKNEFRKNWRNLLAKQISELGEDVLIIGSNKICFPTVLENGEETYLVIEVKIPRGSRNGDEFDPYTLEREYKEKNPD